MRFRSAIRDVWIALLAPAGRAIPRRGKEMWDSLFGAKPSLPSWPEVQAKAREFERTANERDVRPIGQRTYVSEWRTSAKAVLGLRTGGDGETQVCRPPKDSGFKDGEWMRSAEFVRRADAYLKKAKG